MALFDEEWEWYCKFYAAKQHQKRRASVAAALKWRDRLHQKKRTARKKPWPESSHGHPSSSDGDPSSSHPCLSSDNGYSGKEGSTSTNNASATVSSGNSTGQHVSLSQPTAATAAKPQKKTGSQFENQTFENRQQKAMTHSVRPSLPVRSQVPAPQRLRAIAPLPAPTQLATRQMQVLALPIVVAKPQPIEMPREKQIYVVADHQHCVMSNLASLWKSGKLCDAGIGNGSSTVMVHKIVLTAVCPKLLCVSNTDITSHEFLQVNFPKEVSTEALYAFAEYMYNGILDLDKNILRQLKIIAKRLDMKEFENLCDSHLPKHIYKTASVVTSFPNVPLIETTLPVPVSTVSTSIQTETPSINTVVKQEVTDTEVAKIKKKVAAKFGRESEVASTALNKSGNATDFVISPPSIKTEPVGPEDDKYGCWSSSSSNQAYTSTTSSSSLSNTAAASTSIPSSSTEFAIPFSKTTNVKSTRLKAPHSYEPPLVSDLSPVSGIVESACYPSSSINEKSSKPSSQPSDSLSSVNFPNSNDIVYPVRLFSTRGDNLPLSATHPL